jgi:hypothetical protein
VANPNFAKNPISGMIRALQKYGAPMPQAMAEGIANGTVVATPDGTDIDYLCPVDIDGQTLMLDFDTGSSDLWVFSTEQPSSQTQGHTVFDKSKASNVNTFPFLKHFLPNTNLVPTT